MRLLIILALLFVAGCRYEPLYSELDERQANEMLALLIESGVDARKDRVDKFWTLEVQTESLPAAVAILHADGYPRERFDSLGDVFARQGLVSTPLEERARLLHALSQELARTVSSIDGVVTARVHLAIPEHSPLEDNRAPSSASVFIKHRPDAAITFKTASIKALVVNSVEGLPYDNVTVTFFPSDAPPAPVPPPPSLTLSGIGVALPVPAAVSIAVGLVIALGIVVLRTRRRGVPGDIS